MVKEGYKKTEIGVIPEDWEYTIWENAGEGFSSGATPYRGIKNYYGGNIRWVSSGELKYNVIIDTIEHITEEARIKTNLKVHPSNTFLMAITGLEAAGTRGSCAILGVPATTNQSCMAIYGTDKIDVKYLFYFYVKNGEDFAFKYCQGTKQQSYTASIVKKLPIILPNLLEQKRIAEALSDVDDMISSLEKLIEKKKAIKQGAMLDLLTGKRRLPGFTGEWKNHVFRDVFDFIPNNAFTRAEMSDTGKVKNIHYGDVLTRYGCWIDANDANIPYLQEQLDLKRVSEKCYVQTGDVIIADTAEDTTVGKALEVINISVPVLAGQHTLLCRPKINFAEKFLGYYLNSECYHDQLLPFIVGTKVSSISKASVSQTNIFIPSIEEQTAIASILSDMDREIEELEQKLNKTIKLKQGMMQQLLTGKIRLVEKDTVIEPVRKQNDSIKAKTGHNHQFDDAVMIAAIVNAFYSEKYPLGRKKVQKLLYLLRRKQEVDTSAFKKKAAGPYADEIRYKGGEPILNSRITVSSDMLTVLWF